MKKAMGYIQEIFDPSFLAPKNYKESRYFFTHYESSPAGLEIARDFRRVGNDIRASLVKFENDDKSFTKKKF